MSYTPFSMISHLTGGCCSREFFLLERVPTSAPHTALSLYTHGTGRAGQPNTTHGTASGAQSADGRPNVSQRHRAGTAAGGSDQGRCPPGIMVPSVPLFFLAVPARARRYLAAALSTRLLRGGSCR